MGRYVVLLVAPVIIGVLIAAAVVVVNTLRQRRSDARLQLQSPANLSTKDESSNTQRRRIAS